MGTSRSCHLQMIHSEKVLSNHLGANTVLGLTRRRRTSVSQFLEFWFINDNAMGQGDGKHHGQSFS